MPVSETETETNHFNWIRPETKTTVPYTCINELMLKVFCCISPNAISPKDISYRLSHYYWWIRSWILAIQLVDGVCRPVAGQQQQQLREWCSRQLPQLSTSADAVAEQTLATSGDDRRRVGLLATSHDQTSSLEVCVWHCDFILSAVNSWRGVSKRQQRMSVDVHQRWRSCLQNSS